MNDEQIIVSLASIPERQAGLLCVIERLLPQCDQMIVYLNGYAYDKDILPRDPKLCRIYSPVNEGPRGKFLFCDRMPGYHIIADDDLLYPSDYVYTMIQHIEKLKRKAVVGLHGKVFLYRKPPEPMTFKFYRYDQDVTDYQPVHMLGTGVMAYHSSAFSVGMHNLAPGKIDDQVALLAQAQQVPFVVVPHGHHWVGCDEVLSETSALHQNMQLKQQTSDRIHAFQNWRLYTTDTNDVPNYF